MLTDFLLARIAEESRVRWWERAFAPWRARRRLAACEGRRRMLDALDQWDEPEALRHSRELVLRAAAFPYRNHPDYLDDWTPRVLLRG